MVDPTTQVLLDAMSAVAELPTVRLLEWAGGLLSDESDAVSHGAVLAVQNMCTVGGLSAAEWDTLAEPFLAAYATADATRRTRLTQLFKTLPPQLRQTVRRGLSARLEPVRAPAAWTASRRNRHFALAADVAAEACAAVGVPSQPMAGRLLFELLYDFRSTRVTTSAYLLMASPLAGALLPLLVRLAGDDRDPTTRDGAANAATALQDVSDRPDVGRWVDGDVPGLVTCGLVLSAHAGLPLPEATLRRLLADPGHHPARPVRRGDGRPPAARLAGGADPGRARRHPRRGGLVAGPRPPDDLLTRLVLHYLASRRNNPGRARRATYSSHRDPAGGRSRGVRPPARVTPQPRIDSASLSVVEGRITAAALASSGR